MERLALTCNILYNKDILDKTKLIQKYKGKICPKIIYNDFKEFEELQKVAFKCCENGIREMIYSDEREYNYMRMFGITPNQFYNDTIKEILYNAFEILTKNQVNEWVSHYASIVQLTIANTISSLVENNVWENIYDSLGREGLIKFLLSILKNTFYNCEFRDTSDGFGEKIRYFKCKICLNVDDYLYHDETMCSNCYEKNKK